MTEADSPGELVRVLQPWTEEGEGGDNGSGGKKSSAPSTPPPSSTKQEAPRRQRQQPPPPPCLSAATAVAVCSALAAIARSGDGRCAALISAAGGPGILRGVVRRAATAPSAARSARAALEALGEEEDDEDDFDVDGELSEEKLAQRAEAREKAANYFL